MKKGMIINSYAWDMIEDLDQDEKADLLDALAAYYKGKEVPSISKPTRMAFKRIAADNVKFEADHQKEISQLRSTLGKKGAEARWQTMANDGKSGKNAKNKEKEKEKNKNKNTSVYSDSDGYDERRERIKELMSGKDMTLSNLAKAIKEAN